MTKRIDRRRRRASKPKDYRSERYIEYIFHAELGILQAAELLPELTDGETMDALEALAAQVRSDGLPHFQEQPAGAEGLVTWLIVQQWEDLFRRRGRLSKRDMAGCLNTVLESARTRMRRRGGRRYLKYLQRFMRRMGVSVEAIPAESLEAAAGEDRQFYNLDEMGLDELGDLFVSEPDVMGVDDAFENRTRALIAEGKADRVMALCRRLLERADEPYPRAILHTLLGIAYRHQGDLEQAVAMFQAAQSPEVTDIEALDKLAETYREMGRYEQAIETWRRCMEGLPRREQRMFYREIAATYRQMGDPAGEEAALRDLVEASKRKGCLFLGFIKRDSMAALGRLADFLRRQGRESEWQALVTRIRRFRPHPKVDRFEDWVYWVRAWMAIDEQEIPLNRLSRFDGQEPGPVHWIPVLQAALYDQMGRRRDAVPLWRQVRCEIAGRPYAWALTRTRDILGDLLPASSQLFDMIEEAEA